MKKCGDCVHCVRNPLIPTSQITRFWCKEGNSSITLQSFACKKYKKRPATLVRKDEKDG